MKKIYDSICKLGHSFFDNDIYVFSFLLASCISMAYCIVNVVKELFGS